MKTLKEKTLQIRKVDDKLRELGISQYLVDLSTVEKEQAFKALTFEEFETIHPEDHSIKVEMIGVFYKSEFLGATLAGNDREIDISSQEKYEQTKKKFEIN